MEEMIRIPLAELKSHPDNPRTITDEAFQRLKNKIAEFPEMLAADRIAIDEDGMVWCGNQRLRVLRELGYEYIPKEWTFDISGWSLARKKAYAIANNGHDGEWDREKLNSDYWKPYADEYGDALVRKILAESIQETDYDVDDYFENHQGGDIDKKKKIILEYTDDEYDLVKTELSKHGDTPESAVYKLLGL